ncbi:BREX-3 system P-loop-containing protein BrxF [Methanomethylovorans sp.]|uniref:BREX-3 system P-loop-containing protein BrxF n=1 Tax=Methanomethylovorans sp. TaxID=2758717 RepID=UPI00345EE567
MLQDKLKQYLKKAERMYYRLILLVGEADSGKTCILQDIANELGIPVINVNLELSSRLLELTPDQRVLQFQKLLEEITGTNHQALILDNIEIFFDKTLKQDPLRILQKLSRNCLVVTALNGLVEGKKLIYAQLGHPEYQVYNLENTLIVEIKDKRINNT